MKAYKDRDLKRLEKQNHDTNRDNKTIQESQEVILLRKYRWVLLKNQDNINYSDKRYYHSSLRMYADTYTIEKLFLSLDPKFNIRLSEVTFLVFSHNTLINISMRLPAHLL